MRTDKGTDKSAPANDAANGFSDAAIAHGYTVESLTARVRSGILATWYAVAFVAAHAAANVKRDTVLMRLMAAGIGPDTAADYIGTSDAAFSQRRTAIAVLAHAGIDLADATAFDDESVAARLVRVGWRTVYDARDAAMAAKAGADAWRAVERFAEADKSGRAKATATARERAAKEAAAKAEAAEAAMQAVPEDAPEAVRADAERAAKEAAKEAERAQKRAAKATATQARAERDETSVGLSAKEYTAVMAALEMTNAARKAGARGNGTLRIGTFIVLATTWYAAHVGKDHGPRLDDKSAL